MTWEWRGGVAACACAIAAACSAGVTGLEPGDGLDGGSRPDVQSTGLDAEVAVSDAAPRPDAGERPDARAGEDGGRVFTGQLGITWVTNEQELEGHDLTRWQISARVQRGDGWSAPITGEGQRDGTFRIPVPAGKLMIELRPRDATGSPFDPPHPMVVVTDREQVDLGLPLSPRGPPAYPSGTSVRVSGQLASPWIAGDQLGLLWTADGESVHPLPSEALSPGDLTLPRQRLDASALPLHLGAVDDRVTLLRWSPQPTALGPALGITEAGRLGQIQIRARGETPLTFTMVELERVSAELLYDASAARDVRLAHPRAIAAQQTLRLKATPHPTVFGFVDDPRTVEYVTLPGVPLEAGRVALFAPRAGMVHACWRFESEVTLDDGTTFEQASSTNCRLDSELRFTLMAPPANVRVAGRDARAPQSGVGRTPRLEWDPPAGALIGGFRITLRARDGREMQAWTRDPRLDLPAGWLEPGRSYTALITAMSQGSSILDHPRRGTIIGRASTVMTEPFTP